MRTRWAIGAGSAAYGIQGPPGDALGAAMIGSPLTSRHQGRMGRSALDRLCGQAQAE